MNGKSQPASGLYEQDPITGQPPGQRLVTLRTIAVSFGLPPKFADIFYEAHRRIPPCAHAMEVAFDLMRRFSVPVPDSDAGFVLTFVYACEARREWIRRVRS